MNEMMSTIPTEFGPLWYLLIAIMMVVMSLFTYLIFYIIKSSRKNIETLISESKSAHRRIAIILKKINSQMELRSHQIEKQTEQLEFVTEILREQKDQISKIDTRVSIVESNILHQHNHTN